MQMHSCSVLIALILLLLSLLFHPSVIRLLHLILAVDDHDLPNDHPCDAIIVLGYALFHDGTPTEPLKGRVMAGVELLEKKVAPRIIVSGSHTCPKEGLRCDTEANVMMRWAASQQGERTDALDSDMWWKEEKSTSTRENAVFSLELLKERLGGSARSVVIVTSPFHQRRSLWTFERAAKEAGCLDLKIFIARTAFVAHHGYGRGFGFAAGLFNSSIDLWDWIREVLAIIYYKMMGFV